MWRRELALFFHALRFFTRLPVPAWVVHTPDSLNDAARWFPGVGWVVALTGAAVFWCFSQVLPFSLAVLLSMGATLLLTGAFHEDGFGDACDGFGGGWEKSQILMIMKDSRIGSYGSLGLIWMFAAKFAALYEMPDEDLVIALLVAHPLSRFAAVTLIHALNYVREDESSKSRPLAQRISKPGLAWAAVLGCLPLALLVPVEAVLVVLLAGATTWFAGRYFLHRIGGYTGDCLGATQQGVELACYLALHLAWNFI